MEPSKIDQRSFSPKQLNKTLHYCPFRQETKIPVSTFELRYFLGALPTASRVWACHIRTAITLHPTPCPRRVSQVRTPEAPPFVPGTHQAANAGKPQAPHHRQLLPWLLRIRPSPIINRAIVCTRGWHTTKSYQISFVFVNQLTRELIYILYILCLYLSILHVSYIVISSTFQELTDKERKARRKVISDAV